MKTKPFALQSLHMELLKFFDQFSISADDFYSITYRPGNISIQGHATAKILITFAKYNFAADSIGSLNVKIDNIAICLTFKPIEIEN